MKMQSAVNHTQFVTANAVCEKQKIHITIFSQNLRKRKSISSEFMEKEINQLRIYGKGNQSAQNLWKRKSISSEFM